MGHRDRPVAGDLTQAYDLCRQLTKDRAKNFYYAFRTLPSAKRDAIYAAYAFCRHCDDIADEDYPAAEKERLFAQTRLLLDHGGDGIPADPMFVAVKDTAATFGIPLRHFEEVIDGVQMDLHRTRYETFEDLKEYCYKVASVVGLISIEIFGYEDPDAKQHAIDLGLAMQLTNIIRDVKEDAARGRIYLPLDEIASFGYSEEDLLKGTANDAFRGLMKHQVDRARSYFDRGTRLLPLLSPRARACPAVLGSVYGSILDRVEAADFDVFQERIGLSSRQKWLIMARLWVTTLVPTAYRQRG